MSTKMSIARMKRFGQTFEMNVDVEKALQYKKKEITDITDVLLFDHIFIDIKKGLTATSETLAKAFGTTDPLKIAEIIVTEGEIQLTAEHRAEEREQRQRKLITMIHTYAADPKTGLPHPPARIEAALEEARVTLDDHKPVEEQFDIVISKLRPVLPLRIEQKKLIITIPPLYVGRMYQIVKNNSNLLKEEWNSDGSWKIKVEIPVGLQQQFIDLLNKHTHGDITIENE